MKIRSLDQQVGWLLLLTLVVAPNLYTDEPNSQPLAIGAKMPSFELTDFRGREWKSSEFSDKPILAVVFFGTECPLVRLYGSR